MKKSNVGAKPLFIVGCYRSGTSILRLMLNAHPAISIPEETHFFPDFIPRIEKLERDQRLELEDLVRDAIAYLKKKAMWDRVPTAQEVLAAIPTDFGVQEVLAAFAISVGGSGNLAYWGDKTPRYIDASSYLAEKLPDSLFLEIVRDGRDVAASVLSEPLRGGTTALEVAQDWLRKVSYGEDLARLIGSDRVFRVKYEELVTDPRTTLSAICDFLRVDYEPSMLHFYKSKEAISLARQRHHQRVVMPISTSSIGRYKEILTKRERELIEAVTYSKLRILEYEVDSSRGRILTRQNYLVSHLEYTWRSIAFFVLRNFHKLAAQVKGKFRNG